LFAPSGYAVLTPITQRPPTNASAVLSTVFPHHRVDSVDFSTTNRQPIDTEHDIRTVISRRQNASIFLTKKRRKSAAFFVRGLRLFRSADFRSCTSVHRRFPQTSADAYL